MSKISEAAPAAVEEALIRLGRNIGPPVCGAG